MYFLGMTSKLNHTRPINWNQYHHRTAVMLDFIFLTAKAWVKFAHWSIDIVVHKRQAHTQRRQTYMNTGSTGSLCSLWSDMTWEWVPQRNLANSFGQSWSFTRKSCRRVPVVPVAADPGRDKTSALADFGTPDVKTWWARQSLDKCLMLSNVVQCCLMLRANWSKFLGSKGRLPALHVNLAFRGPVSFITVRTLASDMIQSHSSDFENEHLPTSFVTCLFRQHAHELVKMCLKSLTCPKIEFKKVTKA